LEKTSDPLIKTRILYQRAILYFESKQWDAVHTTLLEGKKLNQDFPPLLNLLAYYYATKGNNISEAEKLLETALKKDKNPYYLETRALILYKKGNYAEALKLLNALHKKIPQDSSILYRLAKTMNKQGNIQGARVVLQDAIKFCSLSEDKTKYQQCLARWR
jgi:predicted Zn-dependent protease